MQKITIAIDGFSSTGKSTVAKRVAKALGYSYVDSGAMYRAVTLFAMKKKHIKEDVLDRKALVDDLDKIHLTFKFNPDLGFSEIYLNGACVEKDIRTLAVSAHVSQVATIPEVRRQMVNIQHGLGQLKGIVMDGRDIGTVVFPDAELKLFMTASAEIRAKRRYKELIERGDKVTYEDVLHNVQQRDHIDSTREDSPLIQAEDAIVIDNSHLSLDEQFDLVMNLVRMTLESQE